MLQANLFVACAAIVNGWSILPIVIGGAWAVLNMYITYQENKIDKRK